MNKEKLAADMKYLRSIYQWDDADVAEIREAARLRPDWWDYWTRLAESHRQGKGWINDDEWNVQEAA